MKSITKKYIFWLLISIFTILVIINFFKNNNKVYDINPFYLNENFGIEKKSPELLHNQYLETFNGECTIKKGVTVGDHIRKTKCMYKKKCIAQAIQRCEEQSNNIAKEQAYSMCIAPTESGTLEIKNVQDDSGLSTENYNNLKNKLNYNLGKPGEQPKICNQTYKPVNINTNQPQLNLQQQNNQPQNQQQQNNQPQLNQQQQNNQPQNNQPQQNNNLPEQPPSTNQPYQTSFPSDDSWFYLDHGNGVPIRCGDTGKIECASDDGENCLWGKFGSNYQAYERMKNVSALKPVVVGCPGWKTNDGSNPCESLKCQ